VKFIQRFSSTHVQSLDNKGTHESRHTKLQDWDGGDMVGCCTHNWTMVLDDYRLIRQGRQGRRGEAVTPCAKQQFHCVDLPYETGSEPLAQYHRGETAQGRNTWDAEM